MQADWHAAEWAFLFYFTAQFILENKLLAACWKKKKSMISRVCIFLLKCMSLIENLRSFNIHADSSEKLALQYFSDKNLSEQSLLHIECQTIVNTSVVRSEALCPTDSSNPAAGVSNMEAEISANKS